LFFSPDRKEQKDHDYQKKLGKLTAYFTEILKLTASWRFKQSEFHPFRSPDFLLIFSEDQ
jgi:hypothetical protein